MTQKPTQEPEFDRDGYPTEETLKVISKWKDTYPRWIEYVTKAWMWPERIREEVTDDVFSEGAIVLKFSTGGWSGNESIINAMRENMYWFLFWRSSRRGGHYELKRASKEDADTPVV